MKNLISLGLIALAIALGIFVIKPAYGNISALEVQKSSYDDALANAKQLQSIRDSLTQSYNGISDADKAKLALILPTTFDPVKLSADLSAAAAVEGMSISHVQVTDNTTTDNSRADVVGTTTPGSAYQTFSVSLTTSGSYTEFVQFLKTVESDVELLDLRQVSIESDSTIPRNLDFDVSFDTYAAGQGQTTN